MSVKNILIVCWDFPPNNVIGGRRWAKFAKSLLKLGYNISVITGTSNIRSQNLSWISKNELSKIASYTCSKYFLVKWLNDYSSGLKFFKIRIAKFLLSVFFKGTIFDKAIGIEKKFLTLARKVIKEQEIETVFVTGAPFNLVYYTAQLKTIFPGVRILADYRDPWINAQNYGMQNLSPKRKNQELKKQNYVFENVDFISAPNSFLLQEIKETYTGNKPKIARFIELPHAFDPDDFNKNKPQGRKGPKAKIIYAGTLYLGIDPYLEFLNESIQYIKEHLKDPLPEVDFYTNELNKASIFRSNAGIVNFYQSVGEEIFESINSADFILILLSEHNKNYVTSKFFEFLPYKKPYLYVGPEGYVSEKVEREGLGYCLRKKEDFYQLILNTERRYSSSDIEKYTFDNVTGKMLSDMDLNK